MSKGKAYNIDDSVKEVKPEELSDRRCVVSWLQSCATLTAFTGSYSCIMLIMATIPAYIPSQLAFIERQFSLNSTKSGILLSGNDIGSLVSILIITHFAKRLHIPRTLGCFSIVYGALTVCLAIPNFIVPKHLPEYSTESNESQQLKYICKDSNISETHPVQAQQVETDESKSWVISLFLSLLILMGMVGASRMALVTMYIDDNVNDRSKTSYSVGVLIGMGTFGPTLSLLFGSLFAKIPVDLRETFITQSDPRWIGAWWLAFIILGFTLVLLAVPLLAFPRRLPGAPESERKNGKGAIEEIKDLPASIWRLLTNPIYMLAIIARSLYMFALMGMWTFGPKYLQVQFNLPVYKANYLLGMSHD